MAKLSRFWPLRLLELSAQGAAMVLAVLLCAGCTTTKFQPPTEQSLTAFDAAGPVIPQVKAGEFSGMRAASGPYKIGAGDVISVQVAPRSGGEAFSTVKTDFTQVGVPCRVSVQGTIRLPYVADDIKIVGLTMSEAEAAITASYFPKLLKEAPLVFCNVREYQTQPVSISGAVTKPGRYDMRGDRMTLLSVLGEAGGLAQGGASVVKIRRQDSGDKVEKAIVLTAAKGSVISDDIQLAAGDMIDVDTVPGGNFSVMGLVKGPGRFEYLPGQTITLAQAISYAGGVDWIPDPHWARIYRRDGNGNLVSADFKFSDGRTLLGAANVVLKPGDVVAVEHTNTSAARVIFNDIVKVTFGVNTGLVYTAGQDVRFSGSGGR